MEPVDDLNSEPVNKNSLETILTQGARDGHLDGISLSDDMIKSYICTAHLRIIRQLNCTIRALRECQRKLEGSLECSSPQPEQEDTPKYVQNVMSKSATQDIFRNVVLRNPYRRTNT